MLFRISEAHRRVVAVPVVMLFAAAGAAALLGQEAPTDRFGRQRLDMVDLIAAYGVEDSATLAAMRTVPRHEFVPEEHQRRAYADQPLPIGYGQTISQPYIVAYMTEILEVSPGMKVLEVGTGSGYQAAVLAEIGCQVFSVEIFEALATQARARLARLGYENVTVRHGDGHYGWAEEAPFDAVIVTAAAGHIPPALVQQLEPGGRMVIPVGSVYGVQNLILVEKDTDGGVRTRHLLPVRFVPMLKGPR
ncbi:MAG: protein-L-isoaspartate(D-aspartate) O-methyltransferase [Gemmatimonadales bacterium]|jgi:protein-L-isoaspartate(D-aspartate) O-methyltransferase